MEGEVEGTCGVRVGSSGNEKNGSGMVDESYTIPPLPHHERNRGLGGVNVDEVGLYERV